MRLLTAHYTPETERIRSRCPDGQLWLMLNGGWTTFRKGQDAVESSVMTLSYHVPGEQNRQIVCGKGASLFGIQIPYASLQNDLLAPLAPMQPVFQSGGRSSGLALRLFGAFSCSDTASSLTVEELIPDLLRTMRGGASLSRGREPRWMSRVIALLHDRVSEPLTLQEIGLACEINPVYLSAAFRRTQGCTLGAYLRRLRIDLALRSLISSEREIGEIAGEAGFYDQAHFCRVFKAQIGVSPGQFRRLACDTRKQKT